MLSQPSRCFNGPDLEHRGVFDASTSAKRSFYVQGQRVYLA